MNFPEKLDLEKVDLVRLTEDDQCVCGKCFDAMAFKPLTDAAVQQAAKTLVVAAYGSPAGDRHYPECRGMLDKSAPCPGFYAGVRATVRALMRAGYPFDMGRSRSVKSVRLEAEDAGEDT